MAEHQSITELNYQRSLGILKAHAIISIVFGGLGLAASLFLMAMFAFSVTEYNDYQIAGSLVMVFLVFVFGMLPHAYLVFSGITLLRLPSPSVARTLVIINLIVGVLYNLVVLIMAIINLVQIGDYEAGHKHAKKHHA
jgi:hypothetical protein